MLVPRGIRSRLQHLSQPTNHCRTFAASSEVGFTKAQTQLNALKKTPDNEAKLRMYALFKQATDGSCSKPKPAADDFIQTAKWDAWNGLGSMPKTDAKQEYINIVNALALAELHDNMSAVDAGEEMTNFQYLIYEVEGKAAKITLNRPNTKNSLNRELYFEVPAAFKKASEDPNITLVVLTGAGEYFSSGTDLNNLAHIPSRQQLKETCELGGSILQKYMESFIDFPKPLIAAVNGPAMGLAVTTLALCDVVYASDKATFMTPFTVLGLGPEGCSSHLFPKIMGYAKANEVLLFGKKLSAQEAKDCGLVTEVFPNRSFDEEVRHRVAQYSELPPQSMRSTKGIVRGWEKDLLKKVNKQECDNLVEFWQGKEFLEAAIKFVSKKK
ncbi:putative enoyl-CoA delta isomerase 2, mitochondrial [Apostichopus japonicus]|uniref:Putative enoyl-CoA delta isomerase 2, mitochondrial n=1 Tax=Stichopus japonicus TaxID=307972 RepID=A0A2G8LCS1_STIJA|nr:putative enoyl-CoA delta isomerase 2, mitochondrial [Apostichopus japonicus]